METRRRWWPYIPMQSFTRLSTTLLRRAIIWGGYVLVVSLLGLAAFDARQLQETGDADEANALRQYADKDRVLGRIQRGLSNGTNIARDYLISPWPSRLTTYHTARGRIVADLKDSIGVIERMPEWKDEASDLKDELSDYVDALEAVEAWTDTTRAQHGHHLIQELNDRRNSSAAALDFLTDIAQKQRDDALGKISAARTAKRQGLFTLLISCVLLASAISGFNFLDHLRLQRESRGKLDEIDATKRDLKKLSGRLLHIQEAERRSLSRELHDGIGQTLTALRIEISRAQSDPQIKTEESRERLRRAHGLAEEAVRTIRDISLLLRPTLLDDLGLEPALRWHADEFSRRTGIACEFTVQNVEDLPDDWKTCVYRVVQEALHNCEKHASPTRVHIDLQRHGDVLTTRIQDNGRGFVAKTNGTPDRGGGLGILGMQERAAMLGGTLDLETSPGHGTLIILQLPLTSFNAPQAYESDLSEYLKEADRSLETRS